MKWLISAKIHSTTKRQEVYKNQNELKKKKKKDFIGQTISELDKRFKQKTVSS